VRIAGFAGVDEALAMQETVARVQWSREKSR